MGDRVLFVGGRTDTALFYRAADIVVLPTRADMWGAPTIEAMASGVPIVVSNAAGSSDAVVEGETGYVLPSRWRPDAVAAALDRLAADPDLRARMGARGGRSHRLYTWDRHGEKVESEMLAVVEGRAAAGGH